MSFDLAALRRARASALFGCDIRHFDSIDSTNTVAQRLAAAGAAEGTVVIADAQTKGRGRLGRSWVSPPDRNLYLSLILRPQMAPADAPQLGLMVGLATAEAIRHWAPAALIKWPNDVVLDGRKVAGILTELEADRNRVAFVVVGIGVNLNAGAEDFPPELREKAGSLYLATGARIDRAEFAAQLLAQLESRYQLFMASGFAAIRPLWEQLSYLTGREAQIDAGAQRFTGRVLGLAEDGTLRLRAADGNETQVIAGEVTVIGYEGR